MRTFYFVVGSTKIVYGMAHVTRGSLVNSDWRSGHPVRRMAGPAWMLVLLGRAWTGIWLKIDLEWRIVRDTLDWLIHHRSNATLSLISCSKALQRQPTCSLHSSRSAETAKQSHLRPSYPWPSISYDVCTGPECQPIPFPPGPCGL
jgi:hypothetical protein